jgi:hypothetical protein
MSIWVRYENGEIEKLEEYVSYRNSWHYVREYQMAFGPGFTIWWGLKREAPKC